MFTIVAATIFSTAFLLAMGTIGWMFTLYREKMVAALLFQPIPQTPPVYHVRVRRPRAAKSMHQTSVRFPVSNGILAA